MMRIRHAARALLAAFFFLAALNGCAQRDKTMEVTVAVDFGPAERPPLEKKVSLPEPSTVFDALRGAYAVATSGR